ncbi:unnamed protein product [Fraxinus pennsylvanica]|uniref:RING-type E3 ubiquitin transferase n=1 Tax=Fraxinus pennsylvanica TaxID=56036 RepID=A0AAD1YMU8_9LAMI|nr:unnamed protein product [Fraxinus pennsylvanica]
MYRNIKNSIPGQETTATIRNGNSGNNCCTKATAELKLYQAFIFSVPIFFTFILLLLFYLFYLRRGRVDWTSLRMRTSNSLPSFHSTSEISRCEMGLKKEVREMLPIIVFKESFSVKETQCSVCLADYQSEDKLQQIPACGHTFHMDCIDLWLATHTTCPLCRQSLLASAKATNGEDGEDIHVETNNRSETSLPIISQSIEDDPQTSQQPLESTNKGDEKESAQPAVAREEGDRVS